MTYSMISNQKTSHFGCPSGKDKDRFVQATVEFYRRLACELPDDVRDALATALATEPTDGAGRATLEMILSNIEVCRTESRPLCQDTGIPVFHVTLPELTSQRAIEELLVDATRNAVREVPLRPNAVDPLTGANTGDGVGPGIPMVHFQEASDDRIVVAGMLKGGGCENVALTYKLPDPSLGAGRDLDGVRRCVLDAVWRAQGRACPPYVVGVGIAGAVDAAAGLAKNQLMRKLDDVNAVPELDELEKLLLDQTNRLGIGPGGLGGKSTVLGVKTGVLHRHPASYFVSVSFACWACRRGVMTWQDGKVTYDL